ncbi:MAG: preprotein translocase subunit SecG [Coxiellaceae bacterium]|nr:MAG: preprotein translocase subunit SecG [Coxiellaceae bacterium]
MQQLILILHVLAAVSLIALVLLQQGKGADMGAGFGGGASNTMFGSQGSLPFMMKLTGGLAAVFFITSLTLSYLAAPHHKATQEAPPVTSTQGAPVPNSVGQQPVSPVPAPVPKSGP